MLRRDRLGRYHDERGKLVPPNRVSRHRYFTDEDGRVRSTKGGRFVAKPKRQAAPGRDLRAAFAPTDPIDRAKRQRKLQESRGPAEGAPDHVHMRVNPNALRGTPGERAAELQSAFGVDLKTSHDFATLVELQGREVGRASFSVEDPQGTRDDMTILKGARGAARRASAGAKPGKLLAVTTIVSVQGREIGRETVIVRRAP